MKLISIRKMKKRINVPANVKMGRICAIWLFCIALQAISIPYPGTIRQNYIATEKCDCRGGLD